MLLFVKENLTTSLFYDKFDDSKVNLCKSITTITIINLELDFPNKEFTSKYSICKLLKDEDISKTQVDWKGLNGLFLI